MLGKTNPSRFHPGPIWCPLAGEAVSHRREPAHAKSPFVFLARPGWRSQSMNRCTSSFLEALTQLLGCYAVCN